jgi:hypothetical protein
MEIISKTVVGEIVLVIVVALVVAVFTNRVFSMWAPVRREPSSLNDPAIRRELEEFLHHHGVTGDANIRDGHVFRAVRNSERESLARVFKARYLGAKGRLYYRDAKTGSYRLLGGLDVEHIEDAAMLLEKETNRGRETSADEMGTDDAGGR